MTEAFAKQIETEARQAMTELVAAAKLKKGDVLYSKLRTYLNKVLIADQKGYCTTEILPLDFNGFVVPEYARYVLMSNYFLDYLLHII